MPSTDRLMEFAAVAAAQSISAAARDLGVERATLSRRMSNLEAELGVRLLHRGKSRLVLTPAGQELSRHARSIAADAEEAWSAVRRLDDVPRGLLRVSTVGHVLDKLVIDYVTDFPEVRIDVVDGAHAGGLVADKIDVALRFGPITDLDLIVRRVDARVERMVVASPDYLARHGSPASAQELAEHRCILCSASSWPLRTGGAVPVTGPLRANELRLRLSAACAGVGLALMPAPLIRDELASGALVPVLRDRVGDSAQVSIVFTDREYIDPKVRVFIDRAVPLLEAAYRPTGAA